MPTSKHIKIGEILVEKQFCTSEQIRYALKVQQDYPAKNLGTILLELGFVKKDHLKIALDEQIKLAYKPEGIQH